MKVTKFSARPSHPRPERALRVRSALPLLPLSGSRSPLSLELSRARWTLPLCTLWCVRRGVASQAHQRACVPVRRAAAVHRTHNTTTARADRVPAAVQAPPTCSLPLLTRTPYMYARTPSTIGTHPLSTRPPRLNLILARPTPGSLRSPHINPSPSRRLRYREAAQYLHGCNKHHPRPSARPRASGPPRLVHTADGLHPRAAARQRRPPRESRTPRCWP